MQLINYSQCAKIQHVSKYFPLQNKFGQKQSVKRPNFCDLNFLRLSQKKKSEESAKIHSNVFTMFNLIETAGYSIPTIQLHFIKKQIVKLLEINGSLKKYQEINYWGQMMTLRQDYQVIVCIPFKFSTGVNDMDFWVSQDLKKWTLLPPVDHKIIKHAK